MAKPYSITQVSSVPSGGSVKNIIEGIAGRIIPEDSLVEVAANMGDADVSLQMTIGPDQVLPDGPVNLEASAGVLPSIRDDMIIRTFGKSGDEMILRAANTDAVSAAQIRVVIRVTPVDDAVLVESMDRFNAQVSAAVRP